MVDEPLQQRINQLKILVVGVDQQARAELLTAQTGESTNSHRGLFIMQIHPLPSTYPLFCFESADGDGPGILQPCLTKAVPPIGHELLDQPIFRGRTNEHRHGGNPIGLNPGLRKDTAKGLCQDLEVQYKVVPAHIVDIKVEAVFPAQLISTAYLSQTGNTWTYFVTACLVF